MTQTQATYAVEAPGRTLLQKLRGDGDFYVAVRQDDTGPYLDMAYICKNKNNAIAMSRIQDRKYPNFAIDNPVVGVAKIEVLCLDAERI